MDRSRTSCAHQGPPAFTRLAGDGAPLGSAIRDSSPKSEISILMVAGRPLTAPPPLFPPARRLSSWTGRKEVRLALRAAAMRPPRRCAQLPYISR